MKALTKSVFYSVLSDILIIFSTATLFAIRWARRSYPMHQNRTVYFVMTSDISGHDSNTGFSILTGFIIPAVIIFLIYKLIVLILRRKKIRTDSKKVLCVSAVYFLCSVAAAVIILKAWRYPVLAHQVKAEPVESEFYRKNFITRQDFSVVPPSRKRNLIIIFMESMESSYMDLQHGGVFEQTPMPHLQALAVQNVNFSQNTLIGGGQNLEGTGWTVAGLISKLSAVPYFAPFMVKEGKTVCLPNATALTDILFEQGYTSVFSIGSEKRFENRDAFLESHNMTVHDINWYKENGYIPEDYQVFWGFEDQKLYQIAKKELDLLGKDCWPFCFQLLTVDSHFPYGFKCSSCPELFESQMMNVLACADNLLYDFIQWVKSQSWYENTTIVILGDHCYLNAPENNFIVEQSRLDKETVAGRRRFLNVIINPAEEIPVRRQKEREFSSFDVMPTVLEAIGNKIEGGGIALGRSLLGGRATLLEEYGQTAVEQQTMKRTVEYERLK